MKNKVFGTALVILLAGGGLLWAQTQSSGDSGTGDSSAGRKDDAGRVSREQQPGIPDLKRVKELGASDLQIDKLQQYGFEQHVKRIELQATADNANVALQRLLSGPTPDENAVWTAVAEINQARDELFKLEIAIKLKVKEILGDEIMRKL